MHTTATVVVVALAVVWAIQYVLTFRQMRRFYGRIAQLRRDGVVSVGVAGSTWRRKLYAVLVVDDQDTIVHAEQLSGWTVFASLRPVRGLAGQSMSRLWNDDLTPRVSPKLLQALRSASTHLRNRTREGAEEGVTGESAPAI